MIPSPCGGKRAGPGSVSRVPGSTNLVLRSRKGDAEGAMEALVLTRFVC